MEILQKSKVWGVLQTKKKKKDYGNKLFLGTAAAPSNGGRKGQATDNFQVRHHVSLLLFLSSSRSLSLQTGLLASLNSKLPIQTMVN